MNASPKNREQLKKSVGIRKDAIFDSHLNQLKRYIRTDLPTYQLTDIGKEVLDIARNISSPSRRSRDREWIGEDPTPILRKVIWKIRHGFRNDKEDKEKIKTAESLVYWLWGTPLLLVDYGGVVLGWLASEDLIDHLKQLHGVESFGLMRPSRDPTRPQHLSKLMKKILLLLHHDRETSMRQILLEIEPDIMVHRKVHRGRLAKWEKSEWIPDKVRRQSVARSLRNLVGYELVERRKRTHEGYSYVLTDRGLGEVMMMKQPPDYLRK